MELNDTLAKARQDIHTAFANAVANIGNQLDEKTIKAEIISMLNKEREQIVFKLLGLDNRWGKIEVDHCNGRQTQIGDMIKKHADNAVTEWLSTEVGKTLTTAKREIFAKKEVAAAVKKDFSDFYAYTLKNHVREIAQALALEHATEIKNELVAAMSMKT